MNIDDLKENMILNYVILYTKFNSIVIKYPKTSYFTFGVIGILSILLIKKIFNI